MKIRSGFVSNSSSASYLVIKDLFEYGIKCVKLTKNQILYIRERFKKEFNECPVFRSEEDLNFVISHDDIWITGFVSDCSSLFDKIEDESIVKPNEKILYIEGDLSESPRDEEDFNCLIEYGYENAVWILKEDDKDRKDMNIDEIKSFLEEKGKDKIFDVTYFGNEILIKIKDNDSYSFE